MKPPDYGGMLPSAPGDENGKHTLTGVIKGDDSCGNNHGSANSSCSSKRLA